MLGHVMNIFNVSIYCQTVDAPIPIFRTVYKSLSYSQSHEQLVLFFLNIISDYCVTVVLLCISMISNDFDTYSCLLSI